MIGLFHCPARSIQKFVLIAKMSLEEHFETHLKEKYANEQKEQNSEADIPDFRVGFFEILEENKRRMEKTSTTKTTRLESWMMSSPPKDRQTQKEKNEKDKMRVENV